MAKANAVWGIDIGQCALKALRCTISDDGESIVADKYDFIEYPKILSLPDAEPEEMIKQALTQFLSRNTVLGDQVAISVSGQAGLSRFFKPPPVDTKTLPDIVKYEVRQQIPFPIEDVIWDWQQLGGTIVDGRAVDAEVGLFAMKRDAVYRALEPFDTAEVDVDYVQLSPLSIFNVVCHDRFDELPDPEEFDPENPPESVVVMSMGTDTTDLIVTNGIKLWLRNIPIGGNHFTKQLAREMKLTQAKAEHLKRNARASENPKAIFKAMRPVFGDLVNEVQRSLTYFQSNEKSAELSEIVLLGNAAKLPGLRQFL
ncbi:MAG: pilus assembly protein PilM, partial [Planctomycetota bacterium]